MERHHPKRKILLYQSHRVYHVLDETKPLEIDRCKSKKGASVYEVLALFNYSSGG